jgi:nicotinamidase-related amidase
MGIQDPGLRTFSTPILVAIDIQREYTTEGRPFYLDGIDESLENCRRLRDHARRNRWILAHVRHLQPGALFNPDSEYSRFVEGFEPRTGEPCFEKSNFSCLSNDGFRRLMTGAKEGNSPVYIMGYSGQMCCLSTLVDLHHLGLRATYVADASLSRASKLAPPEGMHRYIREIAGIYAAQAATGDLIAETDLVQPLQAGAA